MSLDIIRLRCFCSGKKKWWCIQLSEVIVDEGNGKEYDVRAAAAAIG